MQLHAQQAGGAGEGYIIDASNCHGPIRHVVWCAVGKGMHCAPCASAPLHAHTSPYVIKRLHGTTAGHGLFSAPRTLGPFSSTLPPATFLTLAHIFLKPLLRPHVFLKLFTLFPLLAHFTFFRA